MEMVRDLTEIEREAIEEGMTDETPAGIIRRQNKKLLHLKMEIEMLEERNRELQDENNQLKLETSGMWTEEQVKAKFEKLEDKQKKYLNILTECGWIFDMIETIMARRKVHSDGLNREA